MVYRVLSETVIGTTCDILVFTVARHVIVCNAVRALVSAYSHSRVNNDVVRRCRMSCERVSLLIRGYRVKLI